MTTKSVVIGESSRPAFRTTRSAADKFVVAVFDTSEPLCAICVASYAAPGKFLCDSCRYDPFAERA